MNLRRTAKILDLRMKRLENQGMTNFAYKSMSSYLQRAKVNSFSALVSQKATFETAGYMERTFGEFLSMKTSTVRGYKEVQNKQMQTLQRTFKQIDCSNVNAFSNFLSNISVTSLQRSKLGSEQTVDFWVKAHDSGLTSKEIEQLFEEYQGGDIKTIDELYDKFGGDFI